MTTIIKSKILNNWKQVIEKEVERLIHRLNIYVRANPEVGKEIKDKILTDEGEPHLW